MFGTLDDLRRFFKNLWLKGTLQRIFLFIILGSSGIFLVIIDFYSFREKSFKCLKIIGFGLLNLPLLLYLVSFKNILTV